MASLEEIAYRKSKRARRLRLLNIIQAVLSGKFDSSKTPMDKMLQPAERNTEEYVNPKERNTNNYGYMESSEMLAGTPYEK